MHRIACFVVCFSAFNLIGATHVAADPILITSGFFLATSNPADFGSVSISGTQGFSLDAKVTIREGRVDVLHIDCFPICLPGSSISLGAFQGGPSFVGTATVEGNSYHLPGSINDTTAVALEFEGMATLPAVQDSLLLKAPFNAMGWFSLPSGNQTLLMSGAGVASVWLSQSPYPDLPRAWVVDQIRYDFAAPAPIPEPATLSLLAIGLAATALRARARRKEKGTSL